MSVTIQSGITGAGNTAPLPGLGIAFGDDNFASEQGEGRDFATILRDLPEPASDKTRAARSKTRERNDADDRPSRAESAHDDNEVDESTSSRKAKKAARRDDESETEKKNPEKATVEKQEAAAPVAAAAATDKAPVPTTVEGEGAASVEEAETSTKTAKTAVKADNVLEAGDDAAQAAAADSDPEITDVQEAATKQGKAVASAEPKLEEQDDTPAPRTDAVRPETAKKAGSDDVQPAIKGAVEPEVSEDDNKVRAASRSVDQDSDASAKAGEATELLTLATQKGEKTGRKAEAVPVKAGNADDAAKTADTKSLPQQAQAKGAGVAASHAPEHAAVVRRFIAAQNEGAERPVPVRAANDSQVSSLAIVAAQAAQAGDQDGATAEGEARQNGLLGNVTPDDDAAPKAGKSEPQAQPMRFDALVSAASGSTPQASILAANNGVSLAGALGQQVVDLGVSGQWINDIARQIATVSANPGQGSFQIASPNLGAVRVDIAPGLAGSNVLMTVENEAAQAALVKDRQRLVQDAQMASIRLGEVRVDRVASLADAQRGDMNNNSNQGQNSNGQSAATAQQGQNGGQGGRQELASQMGQGQNGNSPKASFTRSVINDAASGDASAARSGKGRDGARYA